MLTTKEKIIQHALELGFSKIGFTKPEKLEAEGGKLAEWLFKNYHGDMKWMGKNIKKRLDPKLIFPEVKSVIVTAANYYTDNQRSNDAKVGNISRYAWGDDYHIVVEQKLNELFTYIKSVAPKTDGKVYVDSGSVMEKAWAQRAGIGWQGKHSLIISPQFGSWFFIGIILINVELESDIYSIDQCGDCTLCIGACPTNAIVEPYVLDARKCISYQTIENKGTMDPELSGKYLNELSFQQNWIYGCDICQDVCPWTHKFASDTNISEFYPHEDNINPNLSELESISSQEFNERFKNSPIKRIKHKKFIENIKAVKNIKEIEDERETS
ncbi:MAG: tRNA epoxyqueuosine(34) reductase QueG [Bacteroidota bacterium]|nr:tRNA epoxyqueuosine(34) reductase QueG [Bacteroidota bacterium]